MAKKMAVMVPTRERDEGAVVASLLCTCRRPSSLLGHLTASRAHLLLSDSSNLDDLEKLFKPVAVHSLEFHGSAFWKSPALPLLGIDVMGHITIISSVPIEDEFKAKVKSFKSAVHVAFCLHS